MPGSASARLVISHSSALAGLGRATNASCLLAEPLCVGSPGRGDFSVSPQRATVTSHSTFAAKASGTYVHMQQRRFRVPGRKQPILPERVT